MHSLVWIHALILSSALACSSPTKTADGGRHGRKGQKREKSGSKKRPQQIKVTRIASRSLQIVHKTDGWLEARRRANVQTLRPGIVSRLNVEEGDTVKRGQLLAYVNSEETRLEAIRAELAVVESKEQYDRIQYLRAQGTASEQDEKAQRLVENTAKLDAEISGLRLENMALRAPFDGVVTKRLVHQNEVVLANQVVVEIVDPSTLELQLSIPEEDYSRVVVGTPITLTRYLGPPSPEGIATTTELKTKIARRSPVIDEQNGTLKVIVVVDTPEPSFKPGAYVEASILLEERLNASTLPKAAIFLVEGQAYVFRIEDNKAHRHRIQTGIDDGTFIEILDGLTPDALVITDAEEIDEGMELRPVEDPKPLAGTNSNE